MFLSLDVSFRNTGWVVIDNNKIIDCGVICTEKLSKKERKNISSATETCNNINYIISELNKIFIKYPDIEEINGEVPHGGSQNASASFQLGVAISLIITYVNMKPIKAIWCSPNNIKKRLCGKLDASKEEIMDIITKMYPDYKFPKAKCKFEHIADAIGAYIVCELPKPKG